MLYISLFILFTAISNILLNFYGAKIPHMLLMFLSTTYAILFFNLINYSDLKRVYQKLLNKKKEYFSLLLSLLGIWVGAFLIPIYFLPSIHLFTFMAIGGVLGAIALYRKEGGRYTLFRSLALFMNVFLFYYVCSYYYKGASYLLLIASTMITSISGYRYLVISKKFNNYDFSSSQVLAIRFWFLWLLSLLATIYQGQFKAISAEICFHTLVISAFYLIIPVYCSQKAIEMLGPEKTSLAIGFTPLVTFVFEKLFLEASFNFTGYFSLSLGGLIFIFSLKREGLLFKQICRN